MPVAVVGFLRAVLSYHGGCGGGWGGAGEGGEGAGWGWGCVPDGEGVGGCGGWGGGGDGWGGGEGAEGGSTLAGTDRAVMLKGLRVGMRDVRPDEEIGFLAFTTLGTGEEGKIGREGRLYR